MLAIHPNPYRFLAYLDSSQAGLFDLEGITTRCGSAPPPE